jgi:preprotein translocase subunit SecF
MELFKKTLHIDFLGMRYKAMGLSILLCLFSISAISLYGLRWGLDFTGGTQVELYFQQPVSVSKIRLQIQQSSLKGTQIQSYGSSHQLLLTFPKQTLNTQQSYENILQAIFPQAEIKRITVIGPQASQALLTKTLWALLIALIGILIYISLRFEYRLAVGAIIALIHDPILILGIFAWQHIELNLIALAAILTVMSYSLNNVIVIFDRIRENLTRLPHQSPITLVNQSINETLSRTLITSGITLTMVCILYSFGGPVFHSFSIALMIGILVGEYSAIYIASALAIALGFGQGPRLETANPHQPL